MGLWHSENGLKVRAVIEGAFWWPHSRLHLNSLKTSTTSGAWGLELWALVIKKRLEECADYEGTIRVHSMAIRDLERLPYH